MVKEDKPGSWTKCRICDNPTWIRKAFKDDVLCKACGYVSNKYLRWERWDNNPQSIFSYDFEDLMDYFQSRCPDLYRDLMSHPEDLEVVYLMDYGREKPWLDEDQE